MKQVIENGRIPGFDPFIFFQQVLEAMSTKSSERNSEKDNDRTETAKREWYYTQDEFKVKYWNFDLTRI